MKYEKSCGAIIIKDGKVLLVDQKNNFTAFPKGHIESNETEEETAIREVKEETNLNISIDSKLRFEHSYIVNGNINKTVVYFLGNVVGENNVINQEAEISKAYWVDIDKCAEYITYDDTKMIWLNFLEQYKNIQ